MKHVRLGGGEYGGGEMVSWHAWMKFLTAVAQAYPEVLEGLMADVLPYYNNCSTGKKITLTTLCYSHVCEYEQLKHALLLWATNFNLSYEWVYRTALTTLWCWSIVPGESLKNFSNKWVYPPPMAYWSRDHDISPTSIPSLTWDPTQETLTSAESRIIVEAENAIRKRLSEIKDAYQDRGEEKTPEIRKEEQFTWAAHRIVGNKSYREIADLCFLPNGDGLVLGEDTIRHAVKKVIGLLGIEG